MGTIILIITWYIIGCASFIYWETKERDVLYEDIPFMLFIGMGGPFSFFLGFLLYGDLINNNKNRKKVLFNKRK